MAVKLPPGGRPHTIRAQAALQPSARRKRSLDQLHEGEHELQQPVSVPKGIAAVARKVQHLNRRPHKHWTQQDCDELEELIRQILADAEAEREPQGKVRARSGQADSQQQSDSQRQDRAEQKKMQLRSLLQALEPPEELVDRFLVLWGKIRSAPNFDISQFARGTLMNAKVRGEVLNHQMELALGEADELATYRRVEKVSRDDDTQQQSHSQPDDGGAAQVLIKPEHSLTQSLKVLKRARRTVAVSEAEEVGQRALEVLLMMREMVAPKWAPEMQPWLLQTADRHVYDTVLAVIPESLFRETVAYEGMQRLRAGEHMFSLRAADRLTADLGSSSRR